MQNDAPERVVLSLLRSTNDQPGVAHNASGPRDKKELAVNRLCPCLAALLLLLAAGCAGGGVRGGRPVPPAWCLGASSDSGALRACGEGGDREEAVASGLRQIASQLGVTVRADSSLHEAVSFGGKEERVSSQARRSTWVDTHPVDLEGFEVERSGAKRGRVYALVRLDRAGFAARRAKTVSRILAEADARGAEALRKDGPVEAALGLAAARGLAREAEPLVAAVAAVEPAFPSLRSWGSQLAAHEQAASQALRGLRVAAAPAGAGQASPFGGLFLEALRRDGFETAPGPCGADPRCLELLVADSVRVSEAESGLWVARGRVRASLARSDGAVLGEGDAAVSGSSYRGEGPALDAAADGLRGVLAREGVLEWFGVGLGVGARNGRAEVREPRGPLPLP